MGDTNLREVGRLVLNTLGWAPRSLLLIFYFFSFVKAHLLMEPFCVILKRAMSSKHPLHQILKYHCRDLTIPNSVGTPALIDDGNYMDQLFAFGSNGTGRLLKDAHKIATWEVTDFRGELKVRC